MSATGDIIRIIEKNAGEFEYSECPMDDSGGNFDDAYAMGIRHGRKELANELNAILESL